MARFLDDILSGPDPAAPEPAEPEREPERAEPPAGGGVDGLDASHAALAKALSVRGVWQRNEAEQLAEDVGLTFLDAALDIINETVLELYGEPFTEDTDPVEINVYAAEAMFK